MVAEEEYHEGFRQRATVSHPDGTAGPVSMIGLQSLAGVGGGNGQNED